MASEPGMPAAVPISFGTDARVELGGGLWGNPIPTDYDGDGVNDMLLACPDYPYEGIYYFRNIGSNSKPFFDRAVKLWDPAPLNLRGRLTNLRVSSCGGKQRVTAPGIEYEDFFNSLMSKPKEIKYEGPEVGENWKRIRSNLWNYVDWDGDGDADIIAGVDTWQYYGWDNAWDDEGKWKNGPLVGHVYLLENQDGKYVNKGRIEAGGKPIQTYGAPSPCVADFDGDGDLDLICGEFIDGLTWYENRDGSFQEGRQLANRSGEIRGHIAMIVPVPFDFDADGKTDLLMADEDGTVSFLRNTGRKKKGMPIFKDPVYLMQKADLLKFGALATPCSYDWDNDGEDDIVTGNTAGEIALIRNLGGGKRWDTPKFFRVNGKTWRVMAGPNGSIQGPCERKWGYTVLSVADWDGDGKADILVNTILGKVEWLRGLGGLDLEAPRPVEVAWEGETPKPAWTNWWDPAPGTLATQWRTTPVAIDWNKDRKCDLIVLDTEGYPAYFERLADGRLAPGKRIFHCTNCSLYNASSAGATYNSWVGAVDENPGVLRLTNGIAGSSGRRKICFSDWDGDGLLDLIVDGRFGAVWFRALGENDGLYELEYKGPMTSTRLEGHTTCPTTVDWDKNGVPELLLGAEDGHFYLVKNTSRRPGSVLDAEPDMRHPRLFLRAGEEKALMKNINSDPLWSKMHSRILDECEVICTLEPEERVIIGPRMHAVSCEVLRRVLFLSYGWRTTGNSKFLERAEKEMFHAASFIDWNPSHFLDVSEMATAFAIGYDWLYDALSESSKEIIRNALVKQAFTPALDPKYARPFTLSSNWGQVCNGGMAVAAIAMLDEAPEQAKAILERSCEKINTPMYAGYPPEGCFPEGFGYWAFGTQYNILFLDVLWKFFGREYIDEYLDVPGFIESGNYSQQLITPSLQTFGYSDNSTRIYLEPAVMWFNSVIPDPRMYYRQKALFEKFDETGSYVKTIKNRLIPFMLIWGAGTGEAPLVNLADPEAPEIIYYGGHGRNDICVMRSGWGPDDAYLGFKSGKVNNPHGHMDVGSFYYEYKGVRWSLDLGSDDYGSVQVHGIGLFDMKQGSDRWLKLTKYNNFAHSTTYPEGVYQDINAQCFIEDDEKGMSASSEIAAEYPGMMKSLYRKVSLKGRGAVIEDRISPAGKDLDMVWNMTTEAQSFTRKGSRLILVAEGGKTLKMKVHSRAPFKAELVPATPANSFEGQNEGISFLRLHYTVPSKAGEHMFKVDLKPTD